MTSSPLFVVDRKSVHGKVILRAASEIDGSTTQLLDATTDAIKSASTVVVIDLTDVTFIGSTGLNKLLAATDDCRAREDPASPVDVDLAGATQVQPR
ncbi:STAS domain-containing protein [Lentzea sp. BCCO 10_0856]|uniref:STAS domain-containing protein n=1 Tax=Lentzea miocenica TaxID=3095431 RepID=A0ABU4TGC9_9PSEU|nr:STAS domain-containing protein [Lentzea sp. BCCO 10_0856]MDX8037211.1 STAS domain-containing protein [Lentzea sp. BCCO 10_0856]